MREAATAEIGIGVPAHLEAVDLAIAVYVIQAEERLVRLRTVRASAPTAVGLNEFGTDPLTDLCLRPAHLGAHDLGVGLIGPVLVARIAETLGYCRPIRMAFRWLPPGPIPLVARTTET